MINNYVLTNVVDGTFIKAGVVSEQGLLLEHTVTVYESKSGSEKDTILKHLFDVMKDQIGKIQEEEFQITGVGYAFPGPFDYENGISYIQGLGKFDLLYGVNLKNELQAGIASNPQLSRHFHKDFLIVFDNDASLFAFGEWVSGMAQNDGRYIFITIGTGTGSAFLEKGSLIKHGEDVPSQGWVYKQPFDEGIIDHYVSVRGLQEIARQYGFEPGQYEHAELTNLARKGNANAIRTFEIFGEMLARSLYPFVQDFKPQMVIIGGQISESFDLFGGKLKLAWSDNGFTVEVGVTQNTLYSTLIGISNLIQKKLQISDRTMISGKKAQYIVEELFGIIGRDIDFMNEEGIVVASTSPPHVGFVHPEALLVLKTKVELRISEDDQLAGRKAGIYLPVFFENRVIGVIGLMGTEKEVSKLGEVIRKMTEILVKEQFIERQNELMGQSREVFIRDWIEGRWKDDKLFASKGQVLRINMDLPRVAVIIDIQQEESVQRERNTLDLQKEQNLYFRYLREVIRFNDQDLIIYIGFMKFVALLTLPDTSQEKRKEFITRKIQYILRQMPRSGDIIIKVSVGGYYNGIQGIPVSYVESVKAGLYIKGEKEVNIAFFDDLHLDMLLAGIPAEQREKFVRKILKQAALADADEALQTLTHYFACNQSINKAAERLFIHKNTLQYRLIKIKETTGYDPRQFEEAVLLYLSLYFLSLQQ